MELPSTMQALEVTALNGPESMAITERPVPAAGPGQALIRVAAAGVNFADVMQTHGTYVGGPEPPYVPGIEAAGTVVAVGEEVSLPVGTRVIGAGSRAFAEYVSWPAAGLLPAPESWSDGQAASFFVQWMTAHGCLRTFGRLTEGEVVLVHAAAGGVGTAATRLAKHFGAVVVAAASSDAKLEVARNNGADVLVNTSTSDFVAAVQDHTHGQGADLVLEMVGGETFNRNRKALRPFGRMVVFGAASAEQAQVDNVSLVFEPMELIGYHLGQLATQRPDLLLAGLAEVQQLIADGVIQPDEPTSYPLADGARALSDLASRQTTGKLVLVP